MRQKRVLSYNNRSFSAFRALRLQCISLGKLVSQHLYGPVPKRWSQLYLFKELTKSRSDTEMESM